MHENGLKNPPEIDENLVIPADDQNTCFQAIFADLFDVRQGEKLYL